MAARVETHGRAETSAVRGGQSGSSVSDRDRTVLICDDDQVATATLTRHLVGEGLRVRSFGSTAECLAAMVRDQPGMIVVEPNLASQYWYRFLHGVSRYVDVASTTIVIVTAYPSLAMREEAAVIGIRALLTKPVSPHRIIDALRSRLTTVPFSCSTANSRTLASVEWEHVNEIIRSCRGNITAAARELGLPRQTLYAKLRKIPVALSHRGASDPMTAGVEASRPR